MIQLVVSDVEGTLLEKGKKEIAPNIIDKINSLREAGVLFAVASKRQYPNLRNLFAGVKQELIYICENGALIAYENKVLYKLPILPDVGMMLMGDIWERPGCELVLSGRTTSYLIPKRERFYHYMEQEMGNRCKRILHPEEVQEEYLKICAYCEDGVRNHADYFKSRWENKLQVSSSGEHWIDFNNRNAGKGQAVKRLQKHFGILPEDTVTIGEDTNDMEMFGQSYFSYAMAQADSGVRKDARYVTYDVESVLQDVLLLQER